MENLTSTGDLGLQRRFESKFRRNKNGCWIWTASVDKDNYGQFRAGDRIVRAHRFAYTLYTSQDVPAGMDIDHVCHIRRCVNPDHLEVVPHTENMQRIRAVDDWVNDDKFMLRKTTPEEILELAHDIIERSGVQRPALFGNGAGKGYGVRDCGGAPWRDLPVEEGHIAQDKYALVRLYLDVVCLGVDWKAAAQEILGVSALTVQDWLANPLWREDLDASRRNGRTSRYGALETRHLDVMERKIDDASFSDVSRSLRNLNERDKKTPKQGDEDEASLPIMVWMIVDEAAGKRYLLDRGKAQEISEPPRIKKNGIRFQQLLRDGESVEDAQQRAYDLMEGVIRAEELSPEVIGHVAE